MCWAQGLRASACATPLLPLAWRWRSFAEATACTSLKENLQEAEEECEKWRESGRDTRVKGEARLLFSHLSSKRRASQFHGTFSMIETPAAPGGAGLLCLGVRWGWCPQAVTNSSKPVASFCGDSQVCASPSAPRLGHTPVITVFVFPSFLLEGSWM